MGKVLEIVGEDSDLSSSSDDDLDYETDPEDKTQLKVKIKHYNVHASAMLQLIPLHVFDPKKTLDPKNIRLPKKTSKHRNILNGAFHDFYSTSASSRRDDFGWSPTTEPYSLYTFYQAKDQARKNMKFRQNKID